MNEDSSNESIHQSVRRPRFKIPRQVRRTNDMCENVSNHLDGHHFGVPEDVGRLIRNYMPSIDVATIAWRSISGDGKL
jgi:hypothetical protein